MKLRYSCCFPNCDYTTDDRSLIELHHVNPRELGNVLSKNVTIELCPTHHKMIYHPDATHGQHSRKYDGSMTIVQVATTTTGKTVIFRDSNGTEISVDIDTTVPKKYAIYCISWDIVNGISDRECTDECDSEVESVVDRQGYCQKGSRVYYGPSHRDAASDLLAAYVVQYMTRTKSEYDSVLSRARNDWRQLSSRK